MKSILFIVFFLAAGFLSNAQPHKGVCNVEVSDVSVLTTFGYLNYSVEFHNKSTKTVDAIYWTAYFYNNSGGLIKSEESSFNAGGVIDPVASGFKKTVARMPKVKGAAKVSVIIKKVHFTPGGDCK